MNPDDYASITNYIIIGLIVVAVLFLYFKFALNRNWGKHRKNTVEKWQADGIEFIRGPSGGQFGGLESMGAKRVITGIGLVVITDKDLRVTRAQPSGSWIVTYKQIKGISISWKFMGDVSKKTPFIIVRFVKDGKPDKLGFRVNDYEEWAEELAQKAGVNLRDLSDE